MDVTPALLARAALGVVGAAVLLRGAAIYRPTLALSAFGTGAVAAVALTPSADPRVLGASAVIAGLATLGVTLWAHRIGLVVIGGVVGGVVAFALGATIGLAPWSVIGGAVGGAALAPWLFDKALPYTTPAVGAALIAVAVDRADNPWVIGVLYLVGVAAQARAREVEER